VTSVEQWLLLTYEMAIELQNHVGTLTNANFILVL
jgi:hypothetical protein